MRLAIATFVKTPGLSRVKDRLAKDIGSIAAENFYRDSVRKMEMTLNEFVACRDANCYWVVAESEAVINPLWQGFPRLEQEKGDIGTRLFHTYEKLRENHRYVILLGAGCPQLPMDLLMQTETCLFQKQKPHVLGPLENGSFYLFASGSDFTKEQWEAVSYDSSAAASDFSKKLGLNDDNCLRLPKLYSIDSGKDFERWTATKS